MQLTTFTDYSFRILMYLGEKKSKATIAEIAKTFDVSLNHMVKVAHKLGKEGFIHTIKGRGGGILLVRPPDDIKLGDVVRKNEPHMDVLECFNKETNECPVAGDCRLRQIVDEAMCGFLGVLDQYTLADLLGKDRSRLPQVMHERVPEVFPKQSD